MRAIADGAIPSPNIWHNPGVYELENEAVDPDGIVDAEMAAITGGPAGWAQMTVLDIGCGTGFHLTGLAARARSVIGVEPHSALIARAVRRCARLENVSVLRGTAQALPIPDASVDVASARWAYFFGPSCEPGLAELARVIRRGGTAFVVDIDAGRGTFGQWFRQAIPTYDPDAVEAFWARKGWHRRPLDLRMSFRTRDDLEAVLRIEFPAGIAESAISATRGLELAYPNVLRWRHY